MGGAANTIHHKIFHGGWKEWGGWENKDFRNIQRRRVKRKFAQVSREEIEAGVDEGEWDWYGRYDQGPIEGRGEMFFDEDNLNTVGKGD